jgi:hypothetical protein
LAMCESWKLCRDMYRLPNLEHDLIIWTPTTTGTFTSKSAWESIRIKYNNCKWAAAVWFPSAVPKHAFFMWRLILGKIPTMERLKKISLVSADECIFCWVGKETDHHLFFKCSFAFQIWSQIARKCYEGVFHASWKQILHMIQNNCNANAADNIITKLAFQATVYHIWIERNLRRFQGRGRTIVVMIETIISEVKSKIQNLAPNLSSSAFIANQWELPHQPCLPKRPVQWKVFNYDFQLATDGSYCSSGASCGGILRNKNGTMICAFHTEVPIVSSIFSETMGLLEGLKLVDRMGYHDVEVQADSLLLVKMIQKRIPIPWKLKGKMIEIDRLLNAIRAHVIHVWR